jgi:cytidine deaminase
VADSTPEDEALIAAARAVQKQAWAPISNYHVGAALLAEDGSIIPGCNVEHIILALSCCAEQCAIHAAVAKGHRRFSTVAVVTDSSPPASPCGSCRQVLYTWGVQRVIMTNPQGEILETTIRDLLPLAFALEGPVR